MDPLTIINKLKNHKPTLYSEQEVRKYAVLLPLVEIRGETHLLFEVRSLNLRNQPGDICFPGGGVEEIDLTEKDAARRETAEELGIEETKIHDIYPLDIMLPTPKRIIYPFVGRLDQGLELKPNKFEVAETFTLPLKYFLETRPKKFAVSLQAVPENDFPYHLIVGGKDYDWRSHQEYQYFYHYEDRVIWGLTAKIILNFLSLIKGKASS